CIDCGRCPYGGPFAANRQADQQQGENAMRVYWLWRRSDSKMFERQARDENHALAVFGELLGVKLTTERGTKEAEYEMETVQTETYRSPETPLKISVPVWEVCP